MLLLLMWMCWVFFVWLNRVGSLLLVISMSGMCVCSFIGMLVVVVFSVVSVCVFWWCVWVSLYVYYIMSVSVVIMMVIESV